VEFLAGMREFDDPVILFAIDEHDAYRVDFGNPFYTGLSEERKPMASLIARLVRDADKLENIRNMCLWSGAEFLFPTEKSPLSAHMREVIESGGPVLYKDGSNATDEAAGVINWISDLEFGYTRGAVEMAGFLEAGIAVMRERGATEEDVELVLSRYG
jgi:hypothetical protein